MKIVDYALIVPGSYPDGDADVFGSMQDAYIGIITAFIKERNKYYDPTKVYIFGKPDYEYFVSGGHVNFSAPTGGFAFFNDNIYTIPVVATTLIGGTDYLKTQTDVISKSFSDGTTKDLIYERSLQIGTSSDIDVDDVVVLEYDKWNTSSNNADVTVLSPTATVNSNLFVWKETLTDVMFSFSVNFTCAGAGTPSILLTLPVFAVANSPLDIGMCVIDVPASNKTIGALIRRNFTNHAEVQIICSESISGTVVLQGQYLYRKEKI